MGIGTKLSTVQAEPERVEAAALVLPALKEEGDATWRRVDAALDGALTRLRESGEFTGEPGTSVILHTWGRLAADRVVAVGLGESGKLDGERVRQGVARGVLAAREAGARRVAVANAAGAWLDPSLAGRAAAEGALLALYRFDRHQTKKAEKQVDEVILADAGVDLSEAGRRGRALALATALARDLANEPGNELPPRRLAEEAQRVAAQAGLECEVWDEARLEAEGMGALLAVGRGSAEPPRLVFLRYRCGREGAPTLALVGKGMTFDAGGICLKPADGMEDMKMDKAGAAAVIAALRALAELRPALDVVGVVPMAENMPGGRAQRPGDVVRACNGKTIEVINTDAEGRLILADAVAWAARSGARWIADVATLTGAVVIALGHQAAAVLGNDDALRDQVVAAGGEAGERYWPLPTYEEYKEQYKSQVADLKNVGGRPAGTITGGMIIGEFVGDVPWVHLDIAGVAWVDRDRDYRPKGATGFGTRTLVHLAERLAAAARAQDAGGPDTPSAGDGPGAGGGR